MRGLLGGGARAIAFAAAVACPWAIVEAGPLTVAVTPLSGDFMQVVSGTVGPVTVEKSLGTAGQSYVGGRARADYGTLGAETWAENGGWADASASWEDTFTVTGPAGQFVEFVLTARLTGSLSVPDDTAGRNPGLIGDNYSTMTSFLAGLPLATGESPGCHAGTPANCTASVYRSERRTYGNTTGYEYEAFGDLVTTKRVSLFVGQSYTVTQHLWVRSWVNAMIESSTSANFYGTMRFSLDPVGTDYGYTTASGTNYRTPAVTPVPEAGSIFNFVAGLVSLAALRRRWN